MATSASNDNTNVWPKVSIRQSFNEKLPDFHYDPAVDGTKNASQSGQHTVLTTPPKFAIKRMDTSWSDLGQKVLDEFQLSRDQVHFMLHTHDMNASGQLVPIVEDPQERRRLEMMLETADSFLNEMQFVPEREGNIRHANEADVVRSASLYLVHPVAQAFWAHPMYSASLISQSEDVKDWSRTDLTFYKSKPGHKTRDFMVLEYKRRNAIKREKFEHKYDRPRSWPEGTHDFASLNRLILTPHGHDNHGAAVNALAAVVKSNTRTMNNVGEEIMSLFGNTGTAKLVKQASAYAVEHRTRYVALFNYDNLVLCYFPWLDCTASVKNLRPNFQKKDYQYPVEVEIYPINSDPKKSDSDKVRLALLGFMRAAYDNTPFE